MVIEIDEETLEHTKQTLAKMRDPVKILLFTTKDHCLMCNETSDLIKIVADLSDKITVEECECGKETEEAKKYGIDKHPAIIIHGKKEHKVRYFGIPAGYEFGALIEDIVDASTGEIDLTVDTKNKVKKIDKSIHIQVFTTPTCPYCPRMVRLAHKAAMINEKITADMIEATEFPELAMKYKVMGVPRTIINEKISIEGAVPEKDFIASLLKAAE